MNLPEKLKGLRDILCDMRSVLVAFSGGVDSTFLLKVAHDCLGSRATAVTALSATYSTEELEEAMQFARSLGVRHLFVHSHEMESDAFRSNTPQRCYFCKRELFSSLLDLASNEKIVFVADGCNADDAGDYRPGMKAAQELGIRSPLKEAGLGKDDIRQLSRQMNLPTWDKPTFACFASRFPYGTPITEERLGRVSRAEQDLRDLGIRTLRVRDYGHTARIEVGVDELPSLLDPAVRAQVVKRLKELGYRYVTLDLEGFRSGSMNEVLPDLTGPNTSK